MGRISDQLLPSEVLPGITNDCIVFHNGKGFYYTCKEYSSSLDKRVFKCVSPECTVTATIVPGYGSPLLDIGYHSHSADLTYRDKCILLHTIRQRFLEEGTPAIFILQDVLMSLSLTENEDLSVSCDFESVTLEEEDPSLVLFKDEPLIDPIDVKNSGIPTELDDETPLVLQPVKRTYQKMSRCKLKNNTCELSASTSQSVENNESICSLNIEFVDVKLEKSDEEYDVKSLQDIDDLSEYQENEVLNNSIDAEKKREQIFTRDNFKTSMKKGRRKWNKIEMLKAVLAVKRKEMGFMKASKIYDVPRATLVKYCTKSINELEKFTLFPLGRKPVLSPEIESELVKYCLRMKESGTDLLQNDIKRMAFQLASKNNIRHPFPVTNKAAGRKWLQLFFMRHPNCKENTNFEK